VNIQDERPPHEILFGMVIGTWLSQTVGTIARLRIPDAVAAGAATATAVAEKLSLDTDATYRVMRGAAAAGIFLRLDEERFALSPLGELLRSDVPGSMRAFLDVQSAPGHWLSWCRLDDTVRKGKSQVEEALGSDVWTYFSRNPEEERTFAEAMTGLSTGMVAAILAVHDFGPVTKVVDVGGSQGVFLAGVLNQQPAARGVLFDLPQITAGAGEALRQSGVADRVECVSGDFFASVPEGGDLYLLKHILHDWDDAACIKILENCRQAMAPGGKVAVAEMLIGGYADPPGPAIFLDINMMVMLPGRERTVEEFAKIFAAAGLKLANVVPTQSPVVLLEAVAS
jgi:predicted O-methyltransferase YrrM